MKAKELMIADWVNIMIDGYDNPVQIKKIGQFWVKVTQDDKDYGIILVQPILLTSEILEKNGFKKIREGRFLLEDLEDNYWVKFYPKDANYTCGFYDYIDLDCGCISIREMPIEFVHELQHALRLCGIEKEIVL